MDNETLAIVLVIALATNVVFVGLTIITSWQSWRETQKRIEMIKRLREDIRTGNNANGQ